jgi:hypothetical protein
VRKIIFALLLFLAAAIPALPAALASGADAESVRGFGEVNVQGAQGMRYMLRTRYAVPTSWPRIGRRKGLRQRFGPIRSCRIRVTISAGAVADFPEDAVARATRLLPGAGFSLYDYGTRTTAAFRVVRAPGGKEVNALLVKAAPTVKQQPAPRIVWIELRARAVVDPRTECHSGGPRTVGEKLGDAFAAARVGGFQTRFPS